MPDVLAVIRQGFFERMRMSALAARFVAGAPRSLVVLLIALTPPLLLLAALWLGPEGLRVAATDVDHVRDLFGRVIAGLITASTIAVSVAAFTLRGDLKEFATFRAEQDEKEGFREELRELMGARAAPVLLSELLAATLAAIAQAARGARESAGDARDVVVSGATYEDYLLTIEERAAIVAQKVLAAGTRPDKLHLAALDLEHELVLAMARRYLREERVAGGTRPRLEALHELLRRLQVLVRYTKKLDLEYGLSRMSHTVLFTTMSAVVVAAVVTLTYGPGAVATFGVMPVAAGVCAGLAVVLLPLGAFASHLVRFVFLNQHTLAHDGFLLGPEEPGAQGSSGHRRRGQTA